MPTQMKVTPCSVCPHTYSPQYLIADTLSEAGWRIRQELCSVPTVCQRTKDGCWLLLYEITERWVGNINGQVWNIKHYAPGEILTEAWRCALYSSVFMVINYCWLSLTIQQSVPKQTQATDNCYFYFSDIWEWAIIMLNTVSLHNQTDPFIL